MQQLSLLAKGELCLDVKIVGDGCVPGKPHFDPEGRVCKNCDEVDEAYYSYNAGANACAYCTTSSKSSYD